MKTQNINLLVLAGFLLLSAMSCQAEPIYLKETIGLPGVEGRIDHFAMDAAGGRLFVCALGNNTLEVIDLNKGGRIRSIRCPGAPQGVAYAPGVDRVLVANDAGGICELFDAKSFQKIGTVDFKDDADNVRYDASSKCFQVGFGNGGIGSVSTESGKQSGPGKLPAHPEAFVLEPGGTRIFVNLPTAREVAVFDRGRGEVVADWKTDDAFGNFPMAYDAANHRLFVGCRIPSRLLVFDTDTGGVVAKLAIAGDTDDVFYDEKQHRIYVVCGAGEVDVIDQADPNTYKMSFSIKTADGARTGFYSPERRCLYVAVPHRGSQAAEIRCYGIK